MEFCGHAYAQLDEKNRVRIPVQFKEDLGESPYLIIGANNALYFFTADGYEQMRSEFGRAVSGAEAAAIRMMNMYTYRVHYDNQGRYLLPQVLVDYAKINKDVIFSGNGDKVELWSKEEYDRYNAENPADISKFYSFLGRI